MAAAGDGPASGHPGSQEPTAHFGEVIRAVRILYHGSYWQATVREDAGEIVITRYELRALLDKLESLDHPAG